MLVCELVVLELVRLAPNEARGRDLAARLTAFDTLPMPKRCGPGRATAPPVRTRWRPRRGSLRPALEWIARATPVDWPVVAMEQFWDARAREDAFYFVDSRLRYQDPDESAFWEGGEQALAALLRALEVQVPATAVVLDIGCGLGRLTRPLAGIAERVIALDVSGEMLARARQLNSELANVEWVHGDGHSLRPIADRAVDACISHVVFRHIPDPAITLGYIGEMGRVLRPGGFAAFELSNDPRPHRPRPLPAWSRVKALFGRAPRGQDHDAWLGSSVEIPAIAEVAAGAGMRLERTAGEGTEYCAVLLRRY